MTETFNITPEPLEQKESVKLTRNAKGEMQFELKVIRQDNEPLDEFIARVRATLQKVKKDVLGEAING
jgi:hypothetical protein